MAEHAGEDVVPTIGLEVGPARPLLPGVAGPGWPPSLWRFLVLWPLAVQERFFIHVGILVLLAAIGATSLHLIIRTGHVSLCHASFIGVGAYACVDCVMRLHWPFAAGLAAGAAAAALVALADRADHPAADRQVFRADHLPAGRDHPHDLFRLAVGDRRSQRHPQHSATLALFQRSACISIISHWSFPHFASASARGCCAPRWGAPSTASAKASASRNAQACRCCA